MFHEHSRSVGNGYFDILGKISDEFSFPLHFHKSFEILFVEEGEKKAEINGKEFKIHKGECLLILPGQIHSYYEAKDSVVWLSIFSVDFMPDFYKYCKDTQKHYPVFKINQSELYEKFFAAKNDIFEVKSLLYNIASLYRKGEKYNGFTEKNDSLIYNVVSFIGEHFTESLTLQDVADKFGYNYRYMSSIIGRCFKASFSKVLKQYRVDYACNLLKESGYSITEISSICGFDTTRSFNRSFKEIMGITPSEFKHQNT